MGKCGYDQDMILIAFKLRRRVLVLIFCLISFYAFGEDRSSQNSKKLSTKNLNNTKNLNSSIEDQSLSKTSLKTKQLYKQGKKYNKQGLSFQYGSDWLIDSDKTLGVERTIRMRGPWFSVLILKTLPAKQAKSLQEFSRENSRLFHKSMGQYTYKKIQPIFTPVARKVFGVTIKGVREQTRSIDIGNMSSNGSQIRYYYRYSNDHTTIFMVSHYMNWAKAKADPGLNLIFKTIKYVDAKSVVSL